jgi:prepilin-type N-terminal cleavage/methylation domain-containing protein
MSNKKGLTLMEIIIVMIIVGILATIAIPTYSNYIQQGTANAAQNNLITIYNAEKAYYFSYSGAYCTSDATSPVTSACQSQYPGSLCGDTLAHINCNLGLNITDNNNNYRCAKAGGFTCTANPITGPVTLSVTNSQIYLPGATSCPTGAEASPGCNPSCTPAANSICSNLAN